MKCARNYISACALMFTLSAAFSPVAAEEPIHFIDTHVHYVPLGPDFPPQSEEAVKRKWDGIPIREFLNNMDRWGIDILINEMPPTAIEKASGNQDDYGIPKISELYPGKVFSLYGGKALTMFFKAVEKGNYISSDEEKFVRLLEEAMQSGKYKGFGEEGLHHMPTVKRANLTLNGDHPWMLKLADIAAQYNVPIDIHMEATNESISAFERLLAHNRKTKIIWAHTGWSDLATTIATAELWEQLMIKHSNLYGSIKYSDQIIPRNKKKTSGSIRTDWLHLFEKFSDRFVIGSDIKPGIRESQALAGRSGSNKRDIDEFQKLLYVQQFLHRLPPRLLGPFTKGNAVRIFNLPEGGNSPKEKGR